MRDVNIQGIKPEHLQRLSAGFRETVTGRIDELRSDEDPNSLQARQFFEYLLGEVDAERFDRMRDQYLSDLSAAGNVNMLKYLDPVTWFESKLSIARFLKLHRRKSPIRILDLGTGPGHFAVVARFFGHQVVGTDLPHRSRGVDASGHLYDVLCDLYGVERIGHRIREHEPLGDLRGPYDLVTALLAAFNVDDRKRPWDVGRWRFFLEDVAANVLKPQGALFMRLTHDKLSEESWGYLASIAQWQEDQSRQVFISDFGGIGSNLG